MLSKSTRSLTPSTVMHAINEHKHPFSAQWPRTRMGVLLALIGGGLVLCLSLGCALLPSPLPILALCAVVLLCGILLTRPRLALLVLCACSGLPSLLLPLPGHNMHLVEPAVILLLGTVILLRPSLRAGIPHLLALLFLALAVLSFLHVPEMASAQSPYGADKRLLTWLIVLAAFFCGTWLARTVDLPATFLSALLLVNLPLFGIALAQALGLPLAPPLIAVHDTQRQTLQELQTIQGRLMGPFPWPVNFGMYLVTLFAVALACWFQGTRRMHRLIGRVMTIATLLAIAGSGTRSALIAVSIMLVVACLLTRRFVLLCGTGLLVALACSLFYGQTLAFFNHDTTSTENRLLIWNETIRLIESNPWLGIGLQQFPHYYRQLIVGSASTLSALGINPHEQYLEWALESGLPWLCCGMGLLLSIMLTCGRAYYRLPAQQKCLQFAALLAVLANGITGFFDTPLDQLEGATLLFLLAGLAIGQANSSGAFRFSPGSAIFPRRGRPYVDGKQVIGQSTGMLTPDHTQGRATRRENAHFAQEMPGPWEQSGVSASIAVPTRLSSLKNEPDAQKAGRTIVTQLLSWGIAVPLIFPVTALLARYLGPEQYGVYSLTFPFLTFFALLSGTGMDPLLIRQLSREPRHAWGETLSYAAGTRLVSTLLSVLVAVITTGILPVSGEQRLLFWLGSASLFFSFSFNGLRFIYTLGFRAEQRIGPLAALETCNRLLTAALIVLVVWLRWSLIWGYVLLVYSDLPLFLLLVWIVRKRYGARLRFHLARFREHMLTGLPLLGHQALLLLGGLIDQWVLALVAGPGLMGLFALASRVVDPLISIAFAYVNGLYPLLCRRFEEGPARFADACYYALRLLVLACVPLAVCVTTQATVIVSLLGGERFMAAAAAVQLLIWAMLLTFLNQVAERACTAAHLERRIPLITGCATGVNLLLNVLLIPRWQILGAGIANLVSEGCAFCLFLCLLKPHIRLGMTCAMLALVLFSNMPALAFLIWQRMLSPFLTLPPALLLTGILYFSTRALTWEDIRLARKLFSSLRKREPAPIDEPDDTTEKQNRELAYYPTFIMSRVRP